MTKKDFEAFASMMQRLHPSHQEKEAGPNPTAWRHTQWVLTRNAMCSLFASQNPAFKRERFEKACEPGANVRART